MGWSCDGNLSKDHNSRGLHKRQIKSKNEKYMVLCIKTPNFCLQLIGLGKKILTIKFSVNQSDRKISFCSEFQKVKKKQISAFMSAQIYK